MARRILVIEDEEGMQSFYTAFLRLHGFDVACVGTVEAAIPFAETHPVHLVVLDLSLPGADGETFFDHMEASFPHVPIIVATGHPTPSIRAKVAAKDNARLFCKPFSVEDVCNEAVALLEA